MRFPIMSPPRHHYKTCSLLASFHRGLTKYFYRLGYTIGVHPSYFIIIPIFLSILGLTGLQQMIYESDPEYLFSPRDGQGQREKLTLNGLFPQNFSDNFDPSRLTTISPFARVIVYSQDNGTMFTVDNWNELNLIDELIRNTTIETEDGPKSYKDLCAKHSGKCMKNLIFNLNDIMPEVANGSININYPIMLYPYMFPFFYGGPEVDEERGILLSTKAISLTYFLLNNNEEESKLSLLWEAELSHFLQTTKFEYLNVTFYVSRGLEDELERNSNAVRPYFMVNLVLMFAFSVCSLAAIDWSRSKFLLGLVGIGSAGLATVAAFGFLMYIGVPFIGINLAIPFLILGIGLDDQFVLLAGWHRTKHTKAVPERLAEAYSEAAVSITITSLTNIMSFLVGSFSPFPSVHIFCLYTGTAVFFTYLWFISLFGGVLALAGGVEAENRHALTFKTVMPKSLSKDKSKWYRLFCSGGFNKEDPYNPKDNKEQYVITFCGDYLAKALNKGFVKVIVLFLFGVYMAGAIYGCTQLEEGLERRKLALDDSYLIEFFDKEDQWFRKLPYRIQVVVNETLDYSDPIVKEQILELHTQFENSTYVGDRLYTQSWIRHFYRYLDRRPELKANITDEISFIKVLKKNYFPRKKSAIKDVVFNEDETKITALRFIVQSYEIKDSIADKDMMQEMRRLANEAPFATVVYHPFFVFFDQYLLTRTTSIQAISFAALSMLVVAIIFIPHPLCCLGVAFSIVSIEIGVIGYMALWGVALDSVSMINLIMCIGFSVDFSAHISYAFVTADAETIEERVRMSLQSLGLPVIQGAISTVLGVLILYFAPSYIFRIFFKIVFLVIIFGILHGLLLLPVILSLIFPTDKKSPVAPVGITELVIEEIPSNKVSPVPSRFDIKDETESLDKDLGFGSSLSSRQDSLSDIHSTSRGSDVESVTSRRSSAHETDGIENDAYVEDSQCERL